MFRIRIRRVRKFLGLPYPDLTWSFRHQVKILRKTLISTVSWHFYLWRMKHMYFQKVMCKKTFTQIFFVGVLKVTDEKRRIWIRGTDPRIRICTKMSRIRKHCFFTYFIIVLYLPHQTRWLLQREQPDALQGLRNQLCSERVGQGGTVQPHPHSAQPWGRSVPTFHTYTVIPITSVLWIQIKDPG